jgi:hypothetical protein
MLGLASAAISEVPAGSETSTVSAAMRVRAGSVDPRQFGAQDHTITVISGLQFNGGSQYVDAATLSLGTFNCDCAYRFATKLDLPAGAVIDFIGVNTATTADGALGFTLYLRNESGGTPLASSSLPGHTSFATDYLEGPLNILVPANKDQAYVLVVDTASPSLYGQYLGYVEIWWRRSVSDPPPTPTFGDVPGSHSFYKFVEALASSGITGGCGGGNYCPDSPLTRGQMAVFLSKALGLHWPY